jgi:hypothetical protein
MATRLHFFWCRDARKHEDEVTMNPHTLLFLFCGFILGSVTGSGFAIVRGQRNLARLRQSFVRQLTAIGKRCATAVDPEPGRVRITEAPDVIDYGALVRRLRAKGCTDVPAISDRGKVTIGTAETIAFPPLAVNARSCRPSAP